MGMKIPTSFFPIRCIFVDAASVTRRVRGNRSLSSSSVRRHVSIVLMPVATANLYNALGDNEEESTHFGTNGRKCNFSLEFNSAARPPSSSTVAAARAKVSTTGFYPSLRFFRRANICTRYNERPDSTKATRRGGNGDASDDLTTRFN